MSAGTYNRLGVRTWASDCEVIRAARCKIAPHHRRDCTPEVRAARKAFFRRMLELHHAQQDLVRHFRL